MKVYALSIYWDYEGSEVIGVFDNKEDAEKSGKAFDEDDRRYADGHTVDEFELNADINFGY